MIYPSAHRWACLRTAGTNYTRKCAVLLVSRLTSLNPTYFLYNTRTGVQLLHNLLIVFLDTYTPVTNLKILQIYMSISAMDVNQDAKIKLQDDYEHDYEPLKRKYVEANQEQVFTFYDSLSTIEKKKLISQLSSFDLSNINQIVDRTLHPPKSEQNGNDCLQPLPDSVTASIIDSKTEDIEKWHDLGLNLIAQNQVAVVLMAGGQGTRLGSSAPKGCFDIGLPSGKSLFQLQGERIKKMQDLAKKTSGSTSEVVIPWYTMTSGPTREATRKFFEDHDYFGLEKENVIIFEQGVLPCISNEGKILLESKSQLAVAPDGNGGIYQAMISSNILTDMRKRGIKHIQAYCVDNCLVKVADPVFIGFSASKMVDIATKAVRKRNAGESVGLIVSKNGKPDVIEYSEMDHETAAAMDPHHPGVLKFRAANIVNHYYSFSFLETIPNWLHRLPHHIARKKIPYLDTKTGIQVQPQKPNGIKLEQFVFDCFPMLDLSKFACLEVKREDEFSPLKNAKGAGEDDADTSKRDILQQGRRWAQAAGAIFGNDSNNSAGLEISPLVSYAGEGLEFLKGKTITTSAILK
ncbi:UDP-N-acetylglucosamine pyrophosphorylase [Golovinomyces cichoracearum]|uniref:UDP-N-acetylglucosamine diphosphorylase n=1 Tax=Golovinomyces cichoracearum TaxID=62708 RepID=A0A420J7B0_9PEZI|nr:UDP-N-acetylglucosamine pyrophosphorylase [Golovinomyces cichoracearum]